MQVQDHDLKNTVSALTACPLWYSETVLGIVVLGLFTVGLCIFSVTTV